MCVIMLGENGDKSFLYRMLETGKENCVAAYTKYFPKATKEQIEDFYSFVSNGCVGLMSRWIHAGMKKTPDELATRLFGEKRALTLTFLYSRRTIKP